MEKKLVVKNVSVHFGGLRALDDVSIDFVADKIIGLIGPNGAGKTTLISAISGFVKLVSGNIFLGDRKLTSVRPDLITNLGIARTFQVPSMPGELKVREIIHTAMVYTRERARTIGFISAENVAEFCKVTPLLEIECKSLTFPQLRRLEIARALACGPKMILIDEAIAGLGRQDTEDTIYLIRQIHNLGIGIVMIEHVMSVIRSLCHYVYVLNNGKHLSEGTPDEVLTSPEVQKAYLGEEISFNDV